MTTSPKRQCLSCGAPLSAEAQFCHACGASQAASARSGIPMPWLIGGFLVAIIAVALVAYSVGRSSGPDQSGAAPSPLSGAVLSSAPDISNLSPRMAADSLFNMVMRGHENGDVARVTMFLPMALRAYENLGTLDPDAHYHVGLINFISGELQVALAHADSMEQEVPNNLLATMLRYRVAQAVDDRDEMREQARRFLANYEEQIALDRPEYQDHRNIIENFREQARGTLGE